VHDATALGSGRKQSAYACRMDRAAAEAEAERLNAQHEQRDQFRWFAREDADAWAVIRVPRLTKLQPQTDTTEPPPNAPHPAPPSEPGPYWGF